jgi:hypothetical protein
VILGIKAAEILHAHAKKVNMAEFSVSGHKTGEQSHAGLGQYLSVLSEKK